MATHIPKAYVPPAHTPPAPDVFDIDLRILPTTPGDVPPPRTMPTGNPNCPTYQSTCPQTCSFTCGGTTGSPCAC